MDILNNVAYNNAIEKKHTIVEMGDHYRNVIDLSFNR